LDEKREKLQNKNGNDLFKKPIYIEGKKQNVEIECSLKWNASYSEDVFPYTNNIHQKDGGTHLLGFRSALTRVVNKYANEHNLLKKNLITLSGDDEFTVKEDATKADIKRAFAKSLKVKKLNKRVLSEFIELVA